MPNETVESAPEECSNFFGIHADLAGCGDETDSDIPEVGCCNVIGKDGEGVSECCVLFLKERASLWLLPQNMSPTVVVDPVHGCE